MKDITHICMQIDGESGSPELEKHMALVLAEYFELWKEKQLKYGPSNISSMGKPGLLVRINDKQQRLHRFTYHGIRDTDEGSERDAWMDGLGYHAIGVVFHDGNWPGSPAASLRFMNIIWLFDAWLRDRVHALLYNLGLL